MRFNPTDKALRGSRPDPARQARVDRITRRVAIALAAISTYFFIIKILFL